MAFTNFRELIKFGKYYFRLCIIIKFILILYKTRGDYIFVKSWHTPPQNKAKIYFILILSTNLIFLFLFYIIKSRFKNNYCKNLFYFYHFDFMYILIRYYYVIDFLATAAFVLYEKTIESESGDIDPSMKER